MTQPANPAQTWWSASEIAEAGLPDTRNPAHTIPGCGCTGTYRAQAKSEEQNMNFSRLAPLQNVALLMDLAEQITTRGPGIGLFFGEHGAGKTSATTLVANEYGATVVQAKETWVLSDICASIRRRSTV